MEAKRRAKLEIRARIIKAMAHPTRLFIIEELAGEEQCVHELTEKIGVDISTVSKHLAILKDVGIVEGDKRGPQIYYRLRMPCVSRFLGCVETMMRSAAKRQLALLEQDRG